MKLETKTMFTQFDGVTVYENIDFKAADLIRDIVLKLVKLKHVYIQIYEKRFIALSNYLEFSN